MPKTCGKCTEQHLRTLPDATYGQIEEHWCRVKQQAVLVRTPACEHFREKSDGV